MEEVKRRPKRVGSKRLVTGVWPLEPPKKLPTSFGEFGVDSKKKRRPTSWD